VVLGDAWSGAIVPLQLLSIYAAFRSVITPAPQILMATGHSKQSMYFSLLAAVVLPPAFIIGARWGSPGVAMVWLLVYPIIAIGLFLRLAFRIIGMTARQYIGAIVPAASATLAMALGVLAVRAILPGSWSPIEKLFAQVLVGAAIYSIIVYTVYGDRLRAMRDLLRSESTTARRPEGLIFDSGPTTSTDRLILLSYHFPPDPAVGALRWQKLARFAAERGWGLDVITQDPKELETRDPSSLSDLPPGVRIFAVRSNPPPIERPVNSAWKLYKQVRDRLTWPGWAVPQHQPRPDSKARGDMRWLPREGRDILRAYYSTMEHARYERWARDAARVALRIHDPQAHRAVITCGPPHPVHLGGVLVARRTRLPLILDLRDPWSLVQRLPEAIASTVGLTLARRAERHAVHHASLVVANTHALRNAMRQAYPKVSSRIIAVPNGFDDDPVPASSQGRRFTIAYAGTVYLDRDPRSLFRGAARVIRDLGLTPADFGIDFMGEVQVFDGVPLEAIAQQEGVGEFVKVLPAGSRSEALQFLSRGTVLVALPQDSDMAIPAKLFDYARFDAWVLAFAERGSATDLLLQGTAADLVRPGDPDGLTEVLRKRYLQHLRGERAIRLSVEDRLSRRKQASILFDALEGLVGAPRRPQQENAAPAPQLSRVVA
jgi:glycosyltransferase involved in cell wall biosynthesis